MNAIHDSKLVRLLPTFAAGVFLSVLSSGIGQAQDYIGAGPVLQQVEARSAKLGDKRPPDAADELRNDLKAFSAGATNLAPKEAAQRWLQLANRAIQVQQERRQNYNPNSLPIEANDLMGALPPPNTWSELAKAIVARPPAKGDGQMREAGLRLLAATLTGNKEQRDAEIAALQAKAKSVSQENQYQYLSVLLQLGQAEASMAESPDDVLKSLGYQLAYEGNSSQGIQDLQVPNLVSEIGAKAAENFLRKTLVAPNVTLQFGSPNATSRLAQKLALELMDQVKTPQWGLINSVDAIGLYEAMEKRFPATTNSLATLVGLTNAIPDVSAHDFTGDNLKQTADAYYLLGLIVNNRTAEAITLAKKLNGQNNSYVLEEAFTGIRNAGYAEALADFFHELLSNDPALPFWDLYVEAAADAGQTGRMLSLAQATAQRQDLSDAKKSTLHQILFKALLAADDVDGAVKQARELMAVDATSPAMNGYSYNAGQLGVMVARLGVLLQRPDLISEGVDAAKKWLATSAGQNFSSGDPADIAGSLAKILFEVKRGPEAEAILTDALANATRLAAQNNDGWNPYNQPRLILSELVKLYYKAGRYEDVMTLLEQSPSWGARDLSELFEPSSLGDSISVMWMHTEGAPPLPVPFMAASSLAALARKAAAQKIDEAVLNQYPGLDRGYELLLSLNGTNAIPFLDRMFARDRFEERPLIWKAELLLQQKHLEEAEKTVRQAIAIDPSDGEEGRGDRMRAYAVLAEILDARGDKKDADGYRKIVKAIRLSEDADQFYSAGLLKRAISMYEASLNYFSDAYCIQSRLAVQLAAMGKTAEAEEHYRRAYELMPDSFGRVESHCFGCERVFDGEQAQSIAEKVFKQLATEHPQKPQIHYLLGYLRQEQEHYNAAVTNYETAVRLDPDYLNAWVKLQQVGEQTLMSPQRRDEIVFNILRLDPLHLHAHPDFQRVSDLKGLWTATADVATHEIPRPTNLFTLGSSKAALEKISASAAPGRRPMQFQLRERFMEQMNATTLPAMAVAQTPFVRVASGMIMNNNGPWNE